MSKRTAGVVVGLAVASVAVMATPISTAVASGTASLAASTVKATQMVLAPVSSSAPKSGTAVSPMNTTADAPSAPVAGAKPAATTLTLTPATGIRLTAATVVKPAPKPAPKPPVYRLVRKVSLQLPTTALVGANVTGFIQVLDDNGQVQSPVPNVRVLFQRKDGARWTVLSDDLTDKNGSSPMAFMSQMNMSIRAAYVPGKGGGRRLQPHRQLHLVEPGELGGTPRHGRGAQGATSPTRSGSTPASSRTATSSSRASNNPTKWAAGRTSSIDPTASVRRPSPSPAPAPTSCAARPARHARTAPGYTSSITVT